MGVDPQHGAGQSGAVYLSMFRSAMVTIHTCLLLHLSCRRGLRRGRRLGMTWKPLSQRGAEGRLSLS